MFGNDTYYNLNLPTQIYVDDLFFFHHTMIGEGARFGLDIQTRDREAFNFFFRIDENTANAAYNELEVTIDCPNHRAREIETLKTECNNIIQRSRLPYSKISNKESRLRATTYTQQILITSKNRVDDMIGNHDISIDTITVILNIAIKHIATYLKKDPIAFKAEMYEKFKHHISEGKCANGSNSKDHLLSLLQYSSMKSMRYLRTFEAATIIEPPEIEPPEHLKCPISGRLLEEPIVAQDGYTYSSNSLQGPSRISFYTGQTISANSSIQNRAIAQQVEQWKKENPNYK